MYSKIALPIILVIFQVFLKYCQAEECNDKFLEGLSILKPTTSIHLGKRLEPGDIIFVTGRFSNAGTEASFDLENEKCDWSSSSLQQCLEYDLTFRFHQNKMFRRIYANGGFKHEIDTYTPKSLKRGQFELIIKVKSSHFEMFIDDFNFPPLNFLEPIDDIVLFRTYGFVIVESFKIKSGRSVSMT